jgi:hypothetical protein
MKRLLSLLAVASMFLLAAPVVTPVEPAVAQSKLKKCPKSQSARWHNCFGKLKNKDGSIYEGEWKQGEASGNGTLIWSNGSKYSGEFRESQPNGQGTWSHPKGTRYVGGWKDGEFSGRGTLNASDGTEYVGEWRNNALSGAATVAYKNGDRFSGSYWSWKRDGIGTYVWKNGDKYKGLWKGGVPVDDTLIKPSGFLFRVGSYINEATYSKDGLLIKADVLTTTPVVPKPRPKPIEIILMAAANKKTEPDQVPTPDQMARPKPAQIEVDEMNAPQMDAAPSEPQSNVAEKESLVPEFSKEPSNESLRKVALVIGNGAYQHSVPLENPRNDAEAMTGLLKSMGFDVISGTDLDKRGTEAKISEFVDKAVQSDMSLFYYAGHGIQVDGQNFIVPIDAKVEKASAIDFELVNFSIITDYMGGEKSVGIALLDACRDNPFTRSLSRALGNRSSQVRSGLAELRTQTGGILLGYATAPGDTAADGIGMRNSPFATALLKHLGTKGLEIELVMKRVKAEVIEMTKNEQRPWTNSDLATEVYLGGK